MPSHFHSAAKSAGSSAAKSAVVERVGQHDRAEAARRRSAPGGVSRGRRARRRGRRRAARGRARAPRSRAGRAPPRSASACLARRAETPTRRPPVTSFRSAKRPVASRRSSRRSTSGGTSRREAARRVSTTSASGGLRSAGPAPARSARWSRRGRRQVVGEGEELRVDALGDQVAEHGGLGGWKVRSPVSAASAQPRSGSGVSRR